MELTSLRLLEQLTKAFNTVSQWSLHCPNAKLPASSDSKKTTVGTYIQHRIPVFPELGRKEKERKKETKLHHT